MIFIQAFPLPAPADTKCAGPQYESPPTKTVMTCGSLECRIQAKLAAQKAEDERITELLLEEAAQEIPEIKSLSRFPFDILVRRNKGEK